MTDLKDLPGEEAGGGAGLFDGVICLGNTLAHMLSAAELGTALGEMARVLAPGGRAVLQTVNYDRVAAAGGVDFPPITFTVGERDMVFRRLYRPRDDGLITFVTIVEEAPTKTAAEGAAVGRRVFRAETLLRPLVREELVTVAEMAFHGEVESYGNFLFSPWNEASPATVVVASREEDLG